MSDLILEGLQLMLMGMGTVFVFLTILVIGTTFMSRLIMRMPGVPEPETNRRGRSSGQQDNLAEVAAVAAAIKVRHGH